MRFTKPIWALLLIAMLSNACTPMIRDEPTTIQERMNETMNIESGDFNFNMTTFGMYSIEESDLMGQAAEEIGWGYAIQTLDASPYDHSEEQKENFRLFSLVIPRSAGSGNLFIRDASSFWRKYEELKLKKTVQTYPDNFLMWETTTGFEYLGIFSSEESENFRSAARQLDWTYIVIEIDALSERSMFFLALPYDLSKQDALNHFQQTARNLKDAN